MGSMEKDPVFFVKSYDVLQVLRQFGNDEPKDSAPVPELDYFVYFLITAALQGF